MTQEFLLSEMHTLQSGHFNGGTLKWGDKVIWWIEVPPHNQFSSYSPKTCIYRLNEDSKLILDLSLGKTMGWNLIPSSFIVRLLLTFNMFKGGIFVFKCVWIL